MLGAATDPDDRRIIHIADVAIPADIAGNTAARFRTGGAPSATRWRCLWVQGESRRASSTDTR
jgi:hypothetical protein